MPDIEETRLPGVGIRHDFVTKAGNRLGLLSHLSGRRELLVYDDADPDSCSNLIELEEDDVRVLAELLGADHVTEHLTELRQSVHGMTIDWLPVEEAWRHARSALSETGLPERSGLAVVAVVRGDQTIPTPAADFRLQPDDTLVVVGTPDGIRAGLELLRDG